MKRADEFLSLYNRLEEHLCGVANSGPGRGFSQLVDTVAQTNPTVRRWSVRLKTFGKLRNAIVHDSGYPPEVIAEPSSRTLSTFRAIFEEVVNPKRLVPTFSRGVRCFTPGDSLQSVLAFMHKHDYSQVAVRVDGRLCGLSAEGVARWVAGLPDVGGDALPRATVADALRYEVPDGFLCMSANHTVDDAREAFATELLRGKPRLYAILVTQNGTDHEDPLGIVTPWDLLVAKNG